MAHSFAANYGEAKGSTSPNAPDGAVIGWDAAGVVVRAGAEVVAINRNPTQEENLRALGAHEVHADPAEVAAGRLDPGISWRGPWSRYGEAVLDIN